MKLFEYEAKNILKEYGIKVPKGSLATTAAEAREIACEIGAAVAVKAQVLASGRGKAGGILFGDNPDEAQAAASRLLGKSIKGSTVDQVLIEEKVDHDKELFCSVAIDTQTKSYVAMASSQGGVDIEAVASSQQGGIARQLVPSCPWF